MNQFINEDLSEICPIEQKELYILLKQKLKEAKELEDKLHHMKDEDHEWEKLQISLQCEPQNIDNSKYIIIRHALAWHNYFKRATQFIDRNIYDYELIDPPLHYLGKKQCQFMSLELISIKFDKIYISPLLRALETAILLFGNHPFKDQIQFILCPLISEKVSSQYSIYKWGNLTKFLENNKDNIKFDLSLMPQDIEFWQFHMLDKLDQIIGLKPIKEDQEKYIKNKFIKNAKNIQLEKTNKSLQRAREFVNLIKKNNNANQKIGIVSHSQMIKSLLCKGNDPKEVDIKLYNGSIIGVDL